MIYGFANMLIRSKIISAKSELIKDLIRSARRAEAINKKLLDAEQSGLSNQSPEEMLAEFKSDLK